MAKKIYLKALTNDFIDDMVIAENGLLLVKQARPIEWRDTIRFGLAFFY